MFMSFTAITALATLFIQTEAWPMNQLVSVQTAGVTPDLFKNWAPTNQGFLSPCPMVNSWANHNIIPKTNITAEHLKFALE